MKTKYLFILFISLISTISNAQEIGFPITRNYTPKEYNGAPQVWCAIQDNRGVMYFGSGLSILEYDGISWRAILNDKRANTRDFAIDKKGRIYVAAYNDFGYLKINKNGNTLLQSLTKCLTDTTFKFGTVWSVKTTSEFVYFQTHEGILQYSPNTEKLTVFKALANGRFLGNFVHNDIYYVQLSKKGLMKIEHNELKPAVQSEFFRDKNTFGTAIPFDASKRLIPTRINGLYIYKPDKDTIPKSFTISNEDFLLDNYILNVSLFQKEYFVLGSVKGALLFDKQGTVLQEYKENSQLQNNIILKTFIDATQNLWFGLENGISKTEHSLDLSYWDKNAGLKGAIYSVIRFNGKIYIATSTKLCFIGAANQLLELRNIPVGQNWCFLENKNNNSLLAGTSNGIYEIKGDNAVQVYKGSHALTFSQSVKNPFRVFSTDNDSFISILFEGGKWIFEGKWEGIKDDIQGIIEDESGDIWFGTSRNGVIRVTTDIENITKPKKVRYYTQKDGFASLVDILPFKYKNKIIWGSEKGLYIYNPQTDRFEPFCELGEQFCNGSRSVFSLLEMPDGKVWICPKENKIADIGYLQPNSKGGYDWVYVSFRRIPEMFLNAFYIEPSGIAWIGGSEGLYRYNMGKDTKNYAQKFNCLIRRVTVGADSLLYGGNASTAPSGFQTLIKLDHHFNSLRFEYAAPFFDQEDKTVYSYRLEGYNKEWSGWSLEPKKEFSNLREGTYTFQVKARNIYDVESSTSTYQFTIRPPWYRTIWAYLFYIISLIAIIMVIVGIYTRRIKAANLELEKIVDDRTKKILQQKERIQAHEQELEAFNEELTSTNEELHYQREEILAQNEKLKEMDEFKQGMTSMIVHDLKNPLNQILNIPKSFDADKKDRIIHQSGKQMLNLVLNILDANKYENMSMTVNLDEKQFVLIVLNAISQVQFLLEQKQITLKNGIESGLVTKVEEEVIERVIVNLLTNAIKYTPAGGTIILSANPLSEEMVRIEVTDMGEGIAEDKAHLVFKKFGQIIAKKSGGVRSTGLGLSFCKLAVEAHGGVIGFSSAEGKGTTFWFTLQRGNTENLKFQTIEKEEVIELESIVFTEKEKMVLTPIISRLKAFTVYETDDIEEILEELKQNKSENIQKWVLQIKNAMDTLNQSQFLDLLNIR